MSNLFVVGRKGKIYKIFTGDGEKFENDAEKRGKNTRLLVVMRVGILQKIGLLGLTNRTRFKK